MILYEAWMMWGGERETGVQCPLFLKPWQSLKWKKKNYPLQQGQIICVQIVALVHRNSQEFGTLNTFHQEIIVPKDLFKKINIS